jgi:CRP/FNR family transcriptional regulator, cyclic AMP receptor protein
VISFSALSDVDLLIVDGHRCGLLAAMFGRYGEAIDGFLPGRRRRVRARSVGRIPGVRSRRRRTGTPSEEVRVGTQDMISQLAKVPLFSGCSRRELQLISKAGKRTSRRAGTVLAREGEAGVGFFLILEGTAEVTIGGRRRTTLGPGEFFGEVALLDGGPRSATVTATSDVELLGITEWVFRGLLHEQSTIAVKLLQTLAGRLRAASKAPTA